MGVRQYSETVGRFTKQDPIGFSSGVLNIYRFVINNPNKYNDPTGLDASDPYGPGNPEPGLDDQSADAVLLVLAGLSTISEARTAAEAIQEAIKDGEKSCKNLRCKLMIHSDHHTFPIVGKKCHLQLTCWFKGASGSNMSFRIPLPDRFCP
jgi:uncharacterized protein RhaS with RHS repeats